MAGNYMDAPAPRLAWDKDGSVAVAVQGGGLVQALPLAMNTALNSEDMNLTYTPSWSITPSFLVILFPIKMDLVSMYIATSGTIPVAVSQDTTNGADGTWTTVVANAAGLSTSIVPDYREAARQVSLAVGSVTTSLKGIRFGGVSTTMGTAISALFLYG